MVLRQKTNGKMSLFCNVLVEGRHRLDKEQRKPGE